MGYDFFSKLRDGQTKQREYEDAIKRAVEIQNKKNIRSSGLFKRDQRTLIN